jgi:hypothetical protein
LTTASYLILTPPGAPAATEKAAFVRDGFRWTAFFFPAIWLLVHRLWFWGIVAIVLQIAATSLSGMPDFALAGLVLGIAVSLLTALEGPQAIVRALEARNWTLRRAVQARDLATAEQLYFSDVPTTETPSAAALLQPTDKTTGAARPPALGLLGYDGE